MSGLGIPGSCDVGKRQKAIGYRRERSVLLNGTAFLHSQLTTGVLNPGSEILTEIGWGNDFLTAVWSLFQGDRQLCVGGAQRCLGFEF